MTDRYSSDCYTVAYITKLKKENEMITSEYNKLLQEIIGGIEFKEIILSGITPLSVLKEMKSTCIQSGKYKQVLKDIREIASPHCSQCVEIIDKINEVLNDYRE